MSSRRLKKKNSPADKEGACSTLASLPNLRGGIMSTTDAPGASPQVVDSPRRKSLLSLRNGLLLWLILCLFQAGLLGAWYGLWLSARRGEGERRRPFGRRRFHRTQRGNSAGSRRRRSGPRRRTSDRRPLRSRGRLLRAPRPKAVSRWGPPSATVWRCVRKGWADGIRRSRSFAKPRPATPRRASSPPPSWAKRASGSECESPLRPSVFYAA